MPENEAEIEVTFLVTMVDWPVEGGTEKIITVGCPELQFVAKGRTKEEAVNNLKKMIEVAVGAAKHGGYLENTLLDLGWTKEGDRWMPPKFYAIVEKAMVKL